MLMACDKETEPQSPAAEPPMVNTCPLGAYTGIAISYQDTRADVDRIGATSIHTWIHWDFIEKEILNPNLTVSEVTDAMIEDYVSGTPEGVDWSSTETYYNQFGGLKHVVGVGSGWLVDMPLYQGEKITPDAIGRDNYLGLLYLFTRSAVRKYATLVDGWQIENEPNVASESTLVDIRRGDAWKDIEFVTQVLETLKEAVEMEDPTAWITINFHTDLHYEAEVVKWLPIVDMVGIDAYPNFFNGDPEKSETVLFRLDRAKQISDGKPVILMETGYSTFPTDNGFSESNQATYIDNIFSQLDERGICGGFYFKLKSNENKDSQGVLDHIGLVRADDTTKPGWSVLQQYIDQ